MAARIPEELKQRWEQFGDKSRECWNKVNEAAKEHGWSGGKKFIAFWDCMDSKEVEIEESKITGSIDLSPIEIDIAQKHGYEVEPHPICKLSKMAEGMSEQKATRQCIEEGKIHGISEIGAAEFLYELKESGKLSSKEKEKINIS